MFIRNTRVRGQDLSCHNDLKGQRVTHNAYLSFLKHTKFSFLKHTKQLLLVTLYDTTEGRESVLEQDGRTAYRRTDVHINPILSGGGPLWPGWPWTASLFPQGKSYDHQNSWLCFCLCLNGPIKVIFQICFCNFLKNEKKIFDSFDIKGSPLWSAVFWCLWTAKDQKNWMEVNFGL